jgi:hypothetical protein
MANNNVVNNNVSVMAISDVIKRMNNSNENNVINGVMASM